MVVGTSHSESSMLKSLLVQDHFKDLKQDCSNSIANAVELLQSCTEPSIYGSNGNGPFQLIILKLSNVNGLLLLI